MIADAKASPLGVTSCSKKMWRQASNSADFTSQVKCSIWSYQRSPTPPAEMSSARPSPAWVRPTSISSRSSNYSNAKRKEITNSISASSLLAPDSSPIRFTSRCFDSPKTSPTRHCMFVPFSVESACGTTNSSLGTKAQSHTC